MLRLQCNSHLQDVQRMHDLEDTVLSLKRVLNEREREVDELKATNRVIEGDMHQLMTSKKDLEQRLRGRQRSGGGGASDWVEEKRDATAPKVTQDVS